MHVIIIGDIVGSRKTEPRVWLSVLEDVLKKYTQTFDIFRGDSFQAEVSVDQCFEFVFYLKARIKALGVLDVRLGIGVGAIDYVDKHIKNSNGQAFVLAGEAFDLLKKNLVEVKTVWPDFDQPVNIMMDLSMELAAKWTKNMSESVAAAIAHPGINQLELAKKLGRQYQSQVSTELNKAGFLNIKRVIDYCTFELKRRC